MFCRNCGNKLADNAKFCNKCGNPVAVKPSEDVQQVIGESAPAQEQEFFQQEQPVYKPYEPSQQEPIGQPYYQQSAPIQQPVSNPAASMGRYSLSAGVLMLLCCFLVSAPFIKMFAPARYSFSTFSFLKAVSKNRDKNIFSLSLDAIAEGATDNKLFYISLWVQIIFAICALIFIISALVRLAGSRQDKALKVLRELRLSAGMSFCGVFGSVGLMTASAIVTGESFEGLLREVYNAWTYVFLGVSLLALILGIVFAVSAKHVYESAQSYNSSFR